MTDVYEHLIESAAFKPFPFNENSAWLGHLQFADFIIRTHRPKVLVELGSHWGHSYFAFCKSIKENSVSCKSYAVDTWQGDPHAGHYGDEVYNFVNSHNEENYRAFSRLLRMTFDDALNYFSDASVDLLHIDGLHTYEAVKHDFDTWFPKLSPGAIVLFHDINVRERGFGVWKFWEELCERYPNNLAFLHSHGLGVLQLPGNGEDSVHSWLSAVDSDKEKFARYFSAIGGLEQQRFELLSVSGELHARSNQVEEQKRLTEEYHKELLSINAELDIKQKGLESAHKELEATKIALKDVLSSTSWKVSKPVRFIGKGLRRIRHIATLLLMTSRLAGGLRPAIRKAFNLFRNEGYRGVLRGYRYVATRAADPQHLQRNDYQEWIRRYDSLDDRGRVRMAEEIEEWKTKPLISLIMPVYNPNLTWLQLAIDSVKSQIYGNWELCIADDHSNKVGVREFLEKLESGDSRIKVVFRERNGHISQASNSALGIATGAWCALMDQDDMLSEQALYWVVKTINEQPKVKLFYSDEDKINEAGERHNPYFKCDWNRSLFYSQNMICHLGVYERSIVDQIGGFQEGFEGSQDHDLALRFIENIDESEICHIPRILYHWRVHSASTAGGADAKPYALVAGEKAIQAHLERISVQADVTSDSYGYRVKYLLPETLPLVSIIIPTRNGLDLVRTCIESIVNKTRYSNYEIILIDNDSDDPECLGYFAKIQENYSFIRVKRDDRPFNYSALNNSAVEMANGEIICLMNNDIEVIEPDWLSEMVSIVLQPKVGAVGAKLLYPDDTVQHSGVVIGLGGVAGHVHSRFNSNDPGYYSRLNVINEYSAVTAACLLVKKADYEEVGGLNEADLSVAFNDVDFCLKLKAIGLRNVWTPYALLYHHESATRGYEDNPEKVARFNREAEYMKKSWPGYIAHDPCYSPNLTLRASDFTLAWPPRTDERTVRDI
ncbi:glycosyltransferase [Marinobacter arenosus]|uniref:glycosyltransferase n=1 Tax=Marinobacter arenosus TaxID=2856822 RepID=UPI001C4AA7A4|nr:glycosyltransferase [Marinobacter arenosus]MBW0146836.1 glycosyltransferase [Marinobacter arenosus]